MKWSDQKGCQRKEQARFLLAAAAAAVVEERPPREDVFGRSRDLTAHCMECGGCDTC